MDSSYHIDLPLFEPKELLHSIKHLIKIDKSWFPNLDDPGQLYLRMNHFSTDPLLGVKTPTKSKIVAILSPTTLKAKNLAVKCSVDVFKNWPLGHGQYTISGNLGALVPYVSDAKANGFDDYLWLLDDYVQEMTVLNVFFVMINRYGQLELATSMDNGCILPNTIRNTILDMKDKIEAELNLKVVERNISIHEVVASYYEGRLVEIIGCSGPSFIQPISRVAFREKQINLNTNNDSKYVSTLNKMVSDIMIGSNDHPWVTCLED